MGEEQNPPQDMGAIIATMQKAAQQRLRENLETYLDVSKHLTTLAGALSVATAVLYQTFEINKNLAIGTLILFVISFISSMFALLTTVDHLANLARENQLRTGVLMARFLAIVSICTLTGGTMALVVETYFGIK